ncbi:hypothetical protein J6590_041078, partial [Homalodisca vitripennis]
ECFLGGTYRRLETEVHKAKYGNRLSRSTPTTLVPSLPTAHLEVTGHATNSLLYNLPVILPADPWKPAKGE